MTGRNDSGCRCRNESRCVWKRTEIDNVKIKQCPYAMGYVEFEECQQPIGAGPNLKGAKIGEEVRRD